MVESDPTYILLNCFPDLDVLMNGVAAWIMFACTFLVGPQQSRARKSVPTYSPVMKLHHWLVECWSFPTGRFPLKMNRD